MSEVVMKASSLWAFYAAAFQALGVPAAASRTCADGLHYADLRGTATHGAALLNRLYLKMLREGSVDATAVPAVIRDGGATALVDGRNAVGFITAQFAMEQAVGRAGRYGVAAVAARNSSHCGCMGQYTRQALDAGMIGIALTNLGTQGLIPPPGGRDRLLGTNVLAAAAPAGAQPAFSLDMSTAVVAAGRIRLAAERGETVPEGWLTDDRGQPVTDPAAYLDRRAQLNFLGGAPTTGGYKGYGLAVLADILCGTLSGAGVGPEAGLAPEGRAHAEGRDDADIGHFFLAIDVAAFRPAEAFRADLDRMLTALCSCRPADPGQPVSYPGLPEHRHQQGLAGLIRLSAAVTAELESVAAELGVPPPDREE